MTAYRLITAAPACLATGLARLEEFVQGLRAGAVIVSHDREFLTRTVTRVVELDLAQQQVRAYGGGYAGYLAERDVARRHARAEYQEYAGNGQPADRGRRRHRHQPLRSTALPCPERAF